MRARLVVWMRLLVCVVAALYCGSAAFAQRPGERDVFFAGESLPMPPGQNAKWEHADDPLSNAAAVLFEQGMANPQGLEYREIEIAVGDPWSGGEGLVKTHGWILPPQDGREDRFAVAWNGLVYPVARIGAAADLREDWAPAANTAPAYSREFEAATELPSVKYGSPTLLKLVLLLRLGEMEIVRHCEPFLKRQKVEDPYLDMARDWAWLAFERAVWAHARGDDRLARADARLLTRVAPLIEAEAARRGFQTSSVSRSARNPDSGKLLAFFSGQLPDLLADAERRVANPRKPQAAAVPSIAALIDNLEDVSVRQDGQPGGVSLAEGAWVQELVKRGGDAVEPLLETMVHDVRLTRSVSFSRDFRRNRDLIPVSAAAYAALTDLLQVKFKTYDEETGRQYSRKEIADQIRAYWTEKGALPPVERFYATLRDDQAGSDQWLQAAGYLVQPNNTETHGRWIKTTPAKPGEVVQMRGEILRDGREPSVARLLAQRSDDIAAVTPDSRNDRSRAIDAGRMAIHLAAWDKAAAIPVLQRRLDRAWKIRADHNDVPSLMSIAQMTLARAEAGDEAACDEYADWIQKLDLKGIMYYGGEILQPLIRGAARPRVIQATSYLFNDPRSLWSSLMGRDSIARFPDFWRTPLPLTPGFRQQALRGLSEKSVAGAITFYPPEKWDSQTEASIGIGGLGMGYRGSNGDPDTPPPGEKREFRTCDIYAFSYARDQGGPAFQLFWPEAKRDAGVAACRAWLEAKQ